MTHDQLPRFEDLIVPNSVLPSRVLGGSFDQYLFFDADIGSSVEVIAAIRDVISHCFNGEIEALVFNSRSRSLLARLMVNADWLLEITRVGKEVRDSGGADGLTLMDIKGRWVAYQYWPIDFGVLALACRTDLEEISGLKESFFDRTDIAKWLRGQSPRDIELAQSLGADFLAELQKNYS